MGMDRLDSHLFRPFSHSFQTCLGWQDRWTRLVAATHVFADRTTSQYWGLPETSLLTGLSDSTGSCQSALVDKSGVSLSQYHHTTVRIVYHPGMSNRPTQAAVLRRQSHPIIANLPGSIKMEFFNQLNNHHLLNILYHCSLVSSTEVMLPDSITYWTSILEARILIAKQEHNT
jgi:hypothetical protein